MNKQQLSEIAGQVGSSNKFTGPARIIAIDGPAGSGKTTLAKELCELLPNCTVVHMDDLYDGWNQDLITELPNRIKSEILESISKSQSATIKTYDWHKESFTNAQTISGPDFLILEGVGSANPALSDFFALSIWVEAEPSTLLDRLIARDGQQFRQQLAAWQEHETRYFDQLHVRKSCDLVVRGD